MSKDCFTHRCRVDAAFGFELHERLALADYGNLENPDFRDMQEKAIKSVDISYVHETKMDDTITVQYTQTDDNVYNFRLLNSSGVAMLCSIEFKN